MRHEILIIEDEKSIADTIVYALESEGFGAQWCSNAGEGMRCFRAKSFSLIVLDIGLPDENGFDFCRRIRATSNIPIVFLTARSEEIDRVVGLEIGGDDYIVKPFSPRELSARVRAILRRVPQHKKDNPVASNLPETCEFAIDEIAKQVTYCGMPLELSRQEYKIAVALIRSPGRVFSREQLLEAAWEEPAVSGERTVDTHIKALRAKLCAVTPERNPIQTHRGFGYSLRKFT